MSLIKLFRKDKNWTQARLAKELGVTQALVSQLENGERIPSPKLAKKLEKVTGVEFWKFLI